MIGDCLLEAVKRRNQRRRTNREAPLLASSVIGGDSKNGWRILTEFASFVTNEKREGGTWWDPTRKINC